MTILQAIFLGVLQGFTEFLPVSSSGHLVLAQHLLDIQISAESLLGFDILLHCGTLLALLIVYRARWAQLVQGLTKGNKQELLLLLWLLIGTAPAAVVGLLFKDVLTEYFRSQASVAVSLMVTAGVLVLAQYGRERLQMNQLTLSSVLCIGCLQACALIPGISRSGMTITGGRLCGLKRSEALDFSFLLATPAIAGATLLTILDLLNGSITLPEPSMTIVGILTSLLSSILAIYLLKEWVRRISLAWFAVYLIPMGLLLLS